MKTLLTTAAILALCACNRNHGPQTDGQAQSIHISGNPWMPLEPGTVWIYEGDDEGQPLREVVTAHELEAIQGIGDCTPLWKDTYLSGELAERSVEWLFTDIVGNVWMVGEQSWDIIGDVSAETDESWRSDTHGIGPFLLMPADPTVGQYYVHELPTATETFTVINDNVALKTPIGASTDHLEVEQESEPDDVDIILYRPGTGIVHERSQTGSKVIVLHRRPR